MKESSAAPKTLYDLYSELGLPVDLINDQEGFTIFNLKQLKIQVPYESASFRPEYFSFLFVKDGQGHYQMDSYNFPVQAYSIYFTNPGTVRRFAWNHIEEVYLITFDEIFIKTYISPDFFELFPFLLTELVQPKVVEADFFQNVEEIYLIIQREYKQSSPDKYKLIGHLLVVLLYRIKAYFWQDYNPLTEGNRSSQIAKLFKQVLEKHFRDISAGRTQQLFHVQDYANVLHLHPNYLSNVIKAKTGKPITTWIADKTIAEAKLLLQGGEISIKEIAFKLGFSEMAHFSNYFKKHTQISPLHYRKEYAIRQKKNI